MPDVKAQSCSGGRTTQHKVYTIRGSLTLRGSHKVAFHTSVDDRVVDRRNSFAKARIVPRLTQTPLLLFLVVGCWYLSTAITWPGQEPRSSQISHSCSSRFTLSYTDGEAGFCQSVKERTDVLKVGKPEVTVKGPCHTNKLNSPPATTRPSSSGVTGEFLNLSGIVVYE